MSRPLVVIELADHASFARDLAAGGVFVPDCTLRLAEDCDLVVCGVTHQMMIPARVVYVDPRGGAGLELVGFSPEMKRQIADLATAMPIDEPAEDAPAPSAPGASAPPARAPTAPPASPRVATAAPPADDDELHSGFTEPVPLSEGEAIDEDDDLEIPSLFGRAPTGADQPAASEPVGGPVDPAHAEEDLAIPLSADEAYVATIEPSGPAAAGESVFSYGRPGLTVRGGVAHRARSEHGHAGEADAAEGEDAGDDGMRGDATRRELPELHELHEATRRDLAPHADVDPEADDARMLGAEIEAELGLADLADADPEDAGLELDLIDPWGGADATGEAQLASDDEADGDGGAERDGDGGQGDELAGDGAALADGSRPGRRVPRNVHERLRGMTLAAQIRMAAQGELHERIVLERLYGKNVWETLLRNPRLTAPEVARIARLGSLPRVLLEILVGNNAWLQIPEVRRALLANPRLATDQIVKVLRLTPKHELKLAAIQTAYPYTVRHAAKLLLRGD